MGMFTRNPNLNELDLRHFAQVQFSDSWDGRTTCSDGSTWTMLIYKDQIVDRKSVLKVDGSSQLRSRYSSEFWVQAYNLSRVYLEIIRIGRVKYGLGHAPKEENWDTAGISDDMMPALLAHPQYREVVEVFGQTLERLADNRYRVNVEKRYQKN